MGLLFDGEFQLLEHSISCSRYSSELQNKEVLDNLRTTALVLLLNNFLNHLLLSQKVSGASFITRRGSLVAITGLMSKATGISYKAGFSKRPGKIIKCYGSEMQRKKDYS